MMKKLFFLLIISIIIITGCSIETSRTFEVAGPLAGVLNVNLDSESEMDRTIVPDIDMTVSSYDITGSGPNSETFEELNYTGSIFTLESLKEGTWNIDVEAKNSTGIAIANGSGSVDLVGSSTAEVTIAVSPIEGNGTLSINVDWSSASQFSSSANITGSLKIVDGSPVGIVFTKNNQTASFAALRNKGYYTLRVNVQEGAESWDFVDSLRIIYGQTTNVDIDVLDNVVSAPEINVKQGITNIISGSGTYDFSSVNVGSSSSQITFTIENLGNAVLNLTGSPRVAISGASASMFVVNTQPASSVAASGSTTFVMTFSPTSTSAKTATVSITNNDSNEDPYTFTINGNGTTAPVPEINVKQGVTNIPSVTGSYDFGDVNTGSSSPIITFSIENTGLATLNLTGSPLVSISGDTGHFSVGQPASNTISAESFETFTITFSPTSLGVKTAHVSIANNDSDENPYTFTITGTGTEVMPPGDLIDDFDDGSDPNYWGGSFDPGSTSFGSLTHGYDSSNRLGSSGYGYKFDYDVPVSESFVYTGMWLGGDRDLSSYEYLTFWVKGSTNNVPVKIELLKEHTTGEKGFVYINEYINGGVTTSWQEIKIPLKSFVNLSSLVDVDNISFIFEHDYAQASGFPTNAVLYIDDIGFSTNSLDVVKIDSFGDNWGTNALGGNNGDMPSADRHSSTYVNSEFHSPGYCLRSQYNVNFPTNDWGGYWIIFGGGSDGFTPQEGNFSDYRYLTMWTKAASDTQNPEVFKLEVVTGSSDIELVISGITTSWQKKSIDLDSIGGLDKSTIKQINIVYEKWRIQGQSGDISGVVYFDDIQFEK